MMTTEVKVKKSAADRKAARLEKRAAKSGGSSAETLSDSLSKVKIENNRSSTGVLASQKDSRDIKVIN